MSDKTLIIVESPNKAKTIQKYLGSDFTVQASVGHIADLPPKSLGVNLETFEEEYAFSKPDQIARLRALAKSHKRILLASDRDREGEAIAWHLARALGIKPANAERIEYGEVTPEALRAAIASPRRIALDRVDAQRARRVLDRLVGFIVSEEVCWPANAQSAGRVQSPALHLVCRRERAIRGFVAKPFWSLEASYANGLVAFAPDVSAGADAGEADPGEPDADAGTEATPEEQHERRAVPRRFASAAEAAAYRDAALAAPHQVTDVLRAADTKRPPPPYITSTCYQDASRKLGLNTAATAAALQQLFEGGFITYHRTDSPRVDPEFAAKTNAWLQTHHPQAAPAQAPKGRGKSGAQDAHEALRPTALSDTVQPPHNLKPLYDLVRARYLASQCKPATIDRTQVTITAGDTTWVAKGAVVVVPGFLEIWGPYARQDDVLLPATRAGETLPTPEITQEEKKTTPPSRYDDAALIKELESAGVGRPSTYAMIMQTLLSRGYIEEMDGRGKGNKKVLRATDKGLEVDDLLLAVFPELIESSYTATMEDALDRIESGDNLSRASYLGEWYADFRAKLDRAGPAVASFCAERGIVRSGGGGGEPTKTPCDRCGTTTYIKLVRKKDKKPFLKCEACQMMRPVRATMRAGACPKCGSALMQRESMKNKGFKYWLCVRFDDPEAKCTHAEDMAGREMGGTTQQDLAVSCPKCRKGTLRRVDRDGGSGFLACSDRERCKFIADTDAHIRAKACPNCQGDLITRRRKSDKARFWSCATYPVCSFIGNWDAASGPSTPMLAGASAATSPEAAAT
jgi:DNA topoisomerase-1